MPVISGPHQYVEDDLFLDLGRMFHEGLYLKCEGFNFGGSIKLKVAAEMIARAERTGVLTPESILVESSSGNLGVALSTVAANRGFSFVCVTDSRCNAATVALMRALGATVHVVTKPHPTGGLVGARVARVRELLASDARYVWANQYANPANWTAHYRHTAPAILRRFPDLELLFVGAGTTGTLMGCARYLRDVGSGATVIAVDTYGSVSFGGPPGRRLIPGLGMGFRPPLLDRSYVDHVVFIDEAETVRTCRALARHGFLLGGSTGTVLAGALSWLTGSPGQAGTAVAISPDLGERYLHSIYDDEWVRAGYGPDALADTPHTLPDDCAEQMIAAS
jgi:N-(2-amino-2-carboxyethyl)-L-glutamate synthase